MRTHHFTRFLAGFFLAGVLVQSAAAMPPRLSVPKDAKDSIVNVKVRRITEIKPISTTAPPPTTALQGTHKLLVILVETADTPWPDKYRPSRYQELIFDRSTPSLREFYRENSYGLFDLTGKVIGPVRVPGRMADYRYSQDGTGGDRVQRLIGAAVKAAARKTKLSQFDAFDTAGKPKKDGVLDHLMVIYAEKSGRMDGFSPIWPHRGSLDLEVAGKRVMAYTILNHAARLGVYVHEFGHDLGLPDLYDRDYTSHGAGDWCTMASGSWVGESNSPVHISAWGKIRLGWITPKVIAKPMQNVRIPSASEQPFALRIPIGEVDAREYFILENRRRVGFDSKLPAEGLVIWHVDENKGNNDDENRKMVDVVEAARRQDLDRRTKFAFPKYAEDVFTGGGKDLFSDDTSPSARTNMGAPSRIRVKVQTPAERVMVVDIDRPEVFNPGGVPFVISQDGYSFGRFASVPLGAKSEALAQLSATPGGFLAFATEVFYTARPHTRGKMAIRLYENRRGKPGRVLAEKTIRVTVSSEGYTQVRTRIGPKKGIKLSAHQKVWVGVESVDGKLYPAMNPFSTSKKARYRLGRKGALKKTFNFRGKGKTPTSDYIIRLSGFGFIDGSGRPEPLANEDDELVMQLKGVDKKADAKSYEEALEAYQTILGQMEKESRRYESWIPVVVNSIGVMAYELKRYPIAIEHFESSLRRAEAAKDKPNMADIYENLGETHFFAGAYDQASTYCERSRALNVTLARRGRLVENLYWLGRAHQTSKNASEGRRFLEEALVVTAKAFPKDADQESEWRARIDKALKGEPKDEPRVKERSDSVNENSKGKKQKAIYTDLMQFLADDIDETE